jgi:orotidine-5'-phosphate decarboxylase
MSAILHKFERRAEHADSLLCVGLDPEFERIPERFQSDELPLYAFCRWIIQETAAYAAAFKPNVAFFEARGVMGMWELESTIQFLRKHYPEWLTICDAKRGDIGNTNRGYATSIFDALGFDAVTLHPYLGREALAPFLERRDKASIILCQAVAEQVSREWNGNGNCMLVVGATWPEEMRAIRAIAPELTFLVPGVGAQGGDVAAVVAAGLDARGKGLILSSSRSILYSEEPAAAARVLRDEINAARRAVHGR